MFIKKKTSLKYPYGNKSAKNFSHNILEKFIN